VQVTGGMTSTAAEKQFRRVAIAAGVAMWIGLILLAVGAVFSRGPASSPAEQVAASSSLSVTVETPAPTELPAAALVSATATPAPTASPTSEPEATATSTPEPTPTPVPQPPTRLVIPDIGVDTPVVEVGWHEEVVDGVLLAVWDVADYAAGWHRTSARPGEPDNMVIAGHHNMAGEVFRDLVTLQVGAKVSVFAGDVEHVYQVTEVQVLPEKGMPLEVRQANGQWIGQTGSEMLTMVTCWPYNNNTHRVIVRALPVS